MDAVHFPLVPIGIIRTDFKSSSEMPIQPAFSEAFGRAIVKPEYSKGLVSLELFSHIYLIYWFHRSKSFELTVKPYMDDANHGVFSTRAPARPNPVGISVVELVRIEENVVVFRGADMLDMTPLLDIKPYVPRFDSRATATAGWLEKRLEDSNAQGIADNRFEV
ncbi:MAG: tRNA (N6-threonylcarbamoyladenosine(37)-N6)-methyltransferase TrmO [Candidatus Thorarchaeota archaeon]|nr:tRNA (N6-threonylcarbamoyladenosine(37)-N6)-methyltransferase TrmO [Candidatus Thorarchaeota archaeon]